MLSRMPFLLVTNLADVYGVGEQLVQRAARKALPAGPVSLSRDPELRHNAVPVESLLQLRDRTCFQVSLVNQPHSLSVRLIDDQTTIADVVPYRRTPAHPDSLAL